MQNLKKIQQFVREKCGCPVQIIRVSSETSKVYKILPLTLARVLSGRRGDNCLVWQDNKLYFRFDESGNIFEWQLLNGDDTDCTFEQQSEETQIAIAKLLGYKE